MKAVIKMRWLLLILWIAAAVGLMLVAPNMGDLVREKGQLKVPEGYSSTIASEILSSKSEGSGGALDLVLVFHNAEQLTTADYNEAKAAVQKLENEKEQLGIKSITSSLVMPELKEQMESQDHKTIMTLLSVERNNRDVAEIRKALNDALAQFSIEHYYTGGFLVDEDVVINSEQGLRKTELITVGFILVILLLVFRSPVTPIVPLITVALTYLVSQSVVAFLIDWWNFPVSNFTQIFLVAVLFGIGTDYSILLLSRFKEELSQHDSILAAIIKTYKTAGKTVFFSAIAALLGFALIGLAQFKLYQSAVAVAVGIAFLIIALLTIVPFFMAVLGKYLFWPAKGKLEHKDSKLWGRIGRFAIARPMVVIALLAVVVVPLLFTYKGELSYNSLNEISDEYESVKGFNIVADSFGPGEVMPSQIVIEHDQRLDTKEGLVFIEKLSREIARLPEVEKVRSATRPLGDTMEEFQVSSQVEQLDDGLGKGSEGITAIRDGLKEANQKLTESAPQLTEASAGIGELVNGTTVLKEGVVQLRDGLAQLEQGIRSGALGANQIKSGLQEAATNGQQLQTSANQLLQGYQQLGGGLSVMSEEYAKLLSGLQELSATYTSLDTNFSNLLKNHPELGQDRDFLTIQGTIAGSQQGFAQLTMGLETLNAELSKANAGMTEANTGFAQITNGLTAFAQGLQQLDQGMGELNTGLVSAADGQKQVLSQLPEMITGLDQLIAGQSQARDGFASFSDQLGQLTDGLAESVDGLTQVADGIRSAQSYLTELSESPDPQLAGWNLPEEALQHQDFQQVYDQYMSKDRMVTTLDVIFKDNPYSLEAIHAVGTINDVIQQTVVGTEYADIHYGIGGITGTFADLEQISNADYSRTMILMLIGITIILIILLRSIVMPLYLIVSLMITYFTSMSIAELIFGSVFNFEGIGWAIPFFGFVILLALGVDYSIFLMDRFNEHRDLPVEEAIQHAMRKMGTVIISAAVILAGTFAAMMPSGVLSLLQIATVMLIGLMLYALVFLPFFVPVTVKLFGKYNWWPFPHRGANNQSVENNETTHASV